ncbi:MAG: molybdopterin molybdotransferase MoeA [Peptococcaceae bacterium]|nr:molybdopterin molybdotransferase MoeA [Candidatus Syntrophopropionicum ammoniitolerans]
MGDDLITSFENAKKNILNSVKPLGSEFIPITAAYNRVLYEDIVSEIMVPPADDSARDGYAIIAADTRGATKSNPIRLQVVGEIRAGESAAGKKVTPGTAIRIMTGAPIPQNTDSVVQFEDTDEKNGHVDIFVEVKPGQNYRPAGETIRKGDTVLLRGKRLNSADIGILASLNYSLVKVYKQPVVAIISTGDELADPGADIKSGHIRNANAYTIYTEVKKCNAIPEYMGIAKDTLTDVKEIFLKALKANVVISTGGVSKGRYDFVKDIYTALGIEIQFEKVKIRPGKPFTFGKKGDKLFFGLPGNTVPTLTSFIQFVRPALLSLMGAKQLEKPVVNATLEEDINNNSDSVNLVRGYFTIKNNEFYVTSTGGQKPSMLRSMSGANCLIIVPGKIVKLRAGEKVPIQLIDHEEIY